MTLPHGRCDAGCPSGKIAPESENKTLFVPQMDIRASLRWISRSSQQVTLSLTVAELHFSSSTNNPANLTEEDIELAVWNLRRKTDDLSDGGQTTESSHRRADVAWICWATRDCRRNCEWWVPVTSTPLSCSLRLSLSLNQSKARRSNQKKRASVLLLLALDPETVHV